MKVVLFLTVGLVLGSIACSKNSGQIESLSSVVAGPPSAGVEASPLATFATTRDYQYTVDDLLQLHQDQFTIGCVTPGRFEHKYEAHADLQVGHRIRQIETYKKANRLYGRDETFIVTSKQAYEVATSGRLDEWRTPTYVGDLGVTNPYVTKVCRRLTAMRPDGSTSYGAFCETSGDWLTPLPSAMHDKVIEWNGDVSTNCYVDNYSTVVIFIRRGIYTTRSGATLDAFLFAEERSGPLKCRNAAGTLFDSGTGRNVQYRVVSNAVPTMNVDHCGGGQIYISNNVYQELVDGSEVLLHHQTFETDFLGF